jgi:hypothetical protein
MPAADGDGALPTGTAAPAALDAAARVAGALVLPAAGGDTGAPVVLGAAACTAGALAGAAARLEKGLLAAGGSAAIKTGCATAEAEVTLAAEFVPNTTVPPALVVERYIYKFIEDLLIGGKEMLNNEPEDHGDMPDHDNIRGDYE